jgi:hypothetical protein
MDKLQRLLVLTDRVLMHLEHEIPPEAEVMLELRGLVDAMRNESKSAPTKTPFGNEKAGQEKAP